jgi:hypothetical protein
MSIGRGDMEEDERYYRISCQMLRSGFLLTGGCEAARGIRGTASKRLRQASQLPSRAEEVRGGRRKERVQKLLC